MTVVSYTMVVSWQTCKWEFFYRFGLGLAPAQESNSINIGVHGHKLLENFYRAIQNGMDRKSARLAIQHQVAANPPAELLKAWVLVDNYIRDELRLDGSVVKCEEPIIAPVAPDFDLSIGITPDLLWHRTNKWYDLEDYKFIGRAWSDKKKSRYMQLNLYNVILRKLGYPISKGVLRFFNVETGKTSYKVYEPDQTTLDNIFKEFMVSAFEVQEFLNLSIPEQRERATRTLNYNICQFCSYEYPCTLELQGKDASKTLATQYVENTRGTLALIKQREAT